jgi:hypothetical protein
MRNLLSKVDFQFLYLDIISLKRFITGYGPGKFNWFAAFGDQLNCLPVRKQ